MTDNNIQSVLFELQKNLEELSSAKEQVDFFRGKSLEIIEGISEVQHKYVEHLQSIKSDYENRVSDLKNTLTSFIEKLETENIQSIQKIVSKSEETLGKGIESFEIISLMVESSNNEKIEAINTLLEHFNNVLESSKSFIEKLKAIDLYTKFESLTLKTQIIIESINSSKLVLVDKLNEIENSIIVKTNLDKDQVIHNNENILKSLSQKLEVKLNETENSIIVNTNIAIDQVIQNTLSKINSLIPKISAVNNNVSTTILNIFEEQSKLTKTAFGKLNTSLENQIDQTKKRLDKQDKEISTLKTLLFVSIGIIIIGIVINFFLQ